MPLLYLLPVHHGSNSQDNKRIKHRHVHVDTPDREHTDSLLFEERETSINEDTA